MKVSEYLFNEYRAMTSLYVGASKHLRETLPSFSKMHQSEETPDAKETKRLLLDLEKAEDDIQDTLSKIRNIRHTLLGLL
jgi:hypothetical protein